MLSFKKWLEFQTLGGGLDPPKQDPTAVPGAWDDFHGPGADQLPPTGRKRQRQSVRAMKKKMKKKMRANP